VRPLLLSVISCCTCQVYNSAEISSWNYSVALAVYETWIARFGSWPGEKKRAAVELLRTHPLRPRRFGEGHSSGLSPDGSELVVCSRDRTGGPRPVRWPSASGGDPGGGRARLRSVGAVSTIKHRASSALAMLGVEGPRRRGSCPRGRGVSTHASEGGRGSAGDSGLPDGPGAVR